MNPHAPSSLTQQQWFEALWADREDRVYRQFFGTLNEKIHTIPAAVFAGMGKQNPDPRFLTHGVLESPPTPQRPHWLYVTSGMSNPWGESPTESSPPEKFSGLGMEFLLHTPAQARWPIALLHWVMAAQLLIASGELQSPLVEFNDRIPLGRPLLGDPGLITQLLVTHPPAPDDAAGGGDYPPQFTLASGKVDLMLLLGITERETDFVRSQDAAALVALLRHRDIFPLTDPARPSAL